jgi:hypothetical protein
MVIEIDPRTVHIVDQATREHYRLMACSRCGGPELHAKTKPATKCLRCGHYRTLGRITLLVTRQRCRRCQETFWAVLKTTTCEKCRGKSTQEPKVDLHPARPRRPTLKKDRVSFRILPAFRAGETCELADDKQLIRLA